MIKMYKDIRSIKKWITKRIDSQPHNHDLHFYTLESLTPEKIADAIRDHYIDVDEDKLPNLIKTQLLKYPRIIKKEDAYDRRLISIILFVIDHILTSKIYNRKSLDKESGAVHVSTTVLRTIFNDGSYIKHVMAVSQAALILKMASEYVHTTKKSQSRMYQIHPCHISNSDNPLVIVKCPDDNIAKKLLKYRARSRITSEYSKCAASQKVLWVSMYQLCHLQVDYDAALEILRKNLSEEISRAEQIRIYRQEDESTVTPDVINLRYLNGLISLDKMSSDDILDKHIKFDKSGRIHHNLTSFPKEIRHLLSFAGCDEPLAMIDMSNSQPFLLVNLIMEYLSEERGRKITTRKQLEKYCLNKEYKDIMHYVDVLENANFYNECYRLYKGRRRLKEITTSQKEQVRKMIFTTVFYGDGTTNWIEAQRLAEAFRAEYPTVTKVIGHYRAGNTNNLSDKLQRAESLLFIDRILTKLIVTEKRPYILSLHDGLLAPVSSVNLIIDKFRKIYAKSGFQVKIKVDYLATGRRSIETINDRALSGNGGNKIPRLTGRKNHEVLRIHHAIE